ncbi:hypothetical protein [Cryptosporangium phraense]|uniref:NACHT domain-containing protein n=1 Tax=Cryptosporangium phraense TaxID=2593070 RepID=A0A545B010_9ACTN|nr:hypothetical protein [Cryptosporangium phraense]TQS46894.1 hypothetical protein FL583_01035 [Cryptosporangium phraense]
MRGLILALTTAALGVAGNLASDTVHLRQLRNPAVVWGVLLVSVVVAYLIGLWAKAPRDTAIDSLTDAAARLAEESTLFWREHAWAGGLANDWIDVRWSVDLDHSVLDLKDSSSASGRARRKQRKRPAPMPATVPDGSVVDLYDQVFSRFPRAQLVITGPPGSGKSVAMLKLLLSILADRADSTSKSRPSSAVPVWVSLCDWNPEAVELSDYAAAAMTRDYTALTRGPAGRGTARALIDGGHVSLMLDGLDEMPGQWLSAALTAIDAISQRVRVVLTARPDGYTSARSTGRLSRPVVVRLAGIDLDTAAAYLDRGHDDPGVRSQWSDVVERLGARPTSALAAILHTPLGLHLARYGYDGRQQGHQPLELLGLCTDDEIWDVLVAQYLRYAYPVDGDLGRRRRRLRRRRERAIYLLGWVAHHMGQSRDLPWWATLRWLPRRGLVPLGAAALGTLTAVTTGVTALLLGGHLSWWAVPSAAVGGAVAGGWSVGRSAGAAPSRVDVRRLTRDEVTVTTSAAALIGVLFGGLTAVRSGLAAGCWVGFGLAFLVLLGIGRSADRFRGGLLTLWSQPLADSAATTPAGSYRADVPRTALDLVICLPLVTGFLTVSASFSLAPTLALVFGVGGGTVLGAIRGPAPGMLALLSPVATALCWRRWVRMVPTLEVAAQQQVLRRVGAIYQFRHAELQNHLARQWKVGSSPGRATSVPVSPTPRA